MGNGEFVGDWGLESGVGPAANCRFSSAQFSSVRNTLDNMWSKIAIGGALAVMGGALAVSVVDNFAYVDRSLAVAMPKAKRHEVKGVDH
ncbi:hypothetical protein ACLKA7_007489 [Drosophila subpalustris]